MVRISRTVALVAISAALAACSSGAFPSSVTGGAGTPGPIATSVSSAPAVTVAPVATSGSGSGSGPCSVFTAAEIGAFLGQSVSDGQADATKPNTCHWAGSDGTTVTTEKADEILCEAERASVMGAGKGVFEGDYQFGGPATTGDAVGGFQTTNDCYEVVVSPASKAPAPSVLLAFAKQFADRAGG